MEKMIVFMTGHSFQKSGRKNAALYVLLMNDEKRGDLQGNLGRSLGLGPISLSVVRSQLLLAVNGPPDN